MDASQLPKVEPIDSACRYCHLEDFEEVVLSHSAGTVVPSVGAMVEGWVLIFPKRHVLSLSELSETEWAGFSELAEHVSTSVEGNYGPTVRFEHGSAGEGRLAACGVDHAHLHIVPLSIDLRDAIERIDHGVTFSWQAVTGQVPKATREDYVFVADATGQWVSFHAWLPGQVVRRAIAATLNLVEWDWKANARLSNVEATRATLRSA